VVLVGLEENGQKQPRNAKATATQRQKQKSKATADPYGMTNKRTGKSKDNGRNKMREFFAPLRMTTF
jgi:hypothetical protein